MSPKKIDSEEGEIVQSGSPEISKAKGVIDRNSEHIEKIEIPHE